MTNNDLTQHFYTPAAELNSIASQVLKNDAICFGDLTVKKIGRSFGAGTFGVFRVAGRAQTSAGEEEWSAVAKILTIPDAPLPGGRIGSADREIEVYRTRVFDELCGGVRSAKCYAIQVREAVQYLWLEDLSFAPQSPWSEPYFIRGARNVGQFNAYWPEDELPEWGWLGNKGLERFRNILQYTLLDQLTACEEEPLIALATTPEITKRIKDFWRRSGQIFSTAETTTKGIAHADCHPKNLFPMDNGVNGEYLVAIDWTHVGINMLGLDPALMLVSPIKWLELTTDEAKSLVVPVFGAYLNGLKEAGWSGNEGQVLVAYHTALGCESLNLFGVILEIVDNLNFRNKVMNNLGRPIEEIFEQWMPMFLFGLDCIDEAVRLSRKL